MITVTLGFTASDRPNNYIPMCDGYREGAAQTTVTLELPALDASAEECAEAAFVATNAPLEVIESDKLASVVFAALDESPVTVRALSVGDTVTVCGKRFACERVGWVYLP